MRVFFNKEEINSRVGSSAPGVIAIMLLCLCGCNAGYIRPPRNRQARIMVMETTGYCNCGKCCGWERSFFGLGQPVYSYGPNKGKPKQVGVTASGTRARHGTVAADTRYLPFGTVIYVPGYGYGRVEDRGGAIQGKKIDLWFSSHEKALQWGRRKIKVKVWL